MSELPGVADAEAKLSPLVPFNAKQLAHINNYDPNWTANAPKVEHREETKEDEQNDYDQ